MAFTFECKDGGVVCGAKLRADSEEEVVRLAIEHAREQHGVDLTQSETLARYAKSLVRQE